MSNYTLPVPPHCGIYKMPDGTYYYVFGQAPEQDAKTMAEAFTQFCYQDLKLPNLEKPWVPIQRDNFYVVEVSPTHNAIINAALRQVSKNPWQMMTPKVRKAAQWVYEERLKKPYTNKANPPGKSQWKIKLPNGKEVKRPNHGLAHSVRAACYVPYVADYLKKYCNPMIPPDLLSLRNIELIQIAMLFSVVGRENEAGFIPPNAHHSLRQAITNDYFSYRKKSADLFEEYCKANHLVKSPEELKFLKDMLQAMGDPSPSHPIYLLINISHKLDLLRCYDAHHCKKDVEDYIRHWSDPPDNLDAAELIRFAADCIRATGNRLLTTVENGRLADAPRAQGRYGNIFYECSTNADACLRQIESVSPPKFSKKVSKHGLMLPRVSSVTKNPPDVYLHFMTDQDARTFLDRLHQRGELLDVKSFTTGIGEQSSIKILEKDFAAIEEQLHYCLAKVPKTHNQEDSLVDINGEFEPLALIKNGNALVRSVNTVQEMNPGGPDYDWYLDQLERPHTQRPIPLGFKGSQAERKYHRDQRTNKLVVRTFTPYQEMSRQIPLTQNPGNEEYWDSPTQPKSRPIHEERGKPKNTIFTPKTPHSLLRPDGKMLHFSGVGNPHHYLPIGLLSDVKKVHLHGERYIWRRNAGSYRRFWLGEKALDKEQEREQGVSLAQLQHELLNDTIKYPDKVPYWNELLVGGAKTALCALFVPKDDLMNRLNLLCHYLRIREKYHIDVPLVILDGENPPKMYLEEMIRADLQEATNRLQHGTFPYLPNKSQSLQEEVLQQLFKSLGHKTHLKKIPHQPKDIEAMVVKLNVIGGLEREKVRLTQEIDKSLPQRKNAMIRAIRLGHPHLVGLLLKNDFDVREIINEQTGDTALHLAVIQGDFASVKLLLDANADIQKVNRAGLTPLKLAQQMRNKNLINLLTTKQYNKPAQEDLSDYVQVEYKRLGKKDFVLSTEWFAHRFAHSLRGEQKSFLQALIKAHMGRALNGYLDDIEVMHMALDMLEQTMYKGIDYKTDAPSRLQTIIDELRSKLGPAVIDPDRQQAAKLKIMTLLNQGNYGHSFVNKMKDFDPQFNVAKKQSTYRK